MAVDRQSFRCDLPKDHICIKKGTCLVGSCGAIDDNDNSPLPIEFRKCLLAVDLLTEDAKIFIGSGTEFRIISKYIDHTFGLVLQTLEGKKWVTRETIIRGV